MQAMCDRDIDGAALKSDCKASILYFGCFRRMKRRRRKRRRRKGKKREGKKA